MSIADFVPSTAIVFSIGHSPTADQASAEALMRRALALDEAYEHGSGHDFFIVYEGGRSSVGGSLSSARASAVAIAKRSSSGKAWMSA